MTFYENTVSPQQRAVLSTVMDWMLRLHLGPKGPEPEADDAPGSLALYEKQLGLPTSDQHRARYRTWVESHLLTCCKEHGLNSLPVISFIYAKPGKEAETRALLPLFLTFGDSDYDKDALLLGGICLDRGQWRDFNANFCSNIVGPEVTLIYSV